MEINFTELFKVQRKLEAEIENKHPVQPGEDRLAKRILALQVELGECANEWRGFKFWSMDQKPRYEKTDSNGVNGEWWVTYPLLEEYVDCLHFILSIGLEHAEYYGEQIPINSLLAKDLSGVRNNPFTDKDIAIHFNEIFLEVGMLFDATGDRAYNVQSVEDAYENIIRLFVGLGEMLNFTWEQVTNAYMSKNQINHERQANGY